jgi:hypothetical protein
MKLIRIAAKATVTAALCAGALGFGTALAHADDVFWPPIPPGPGVNVGGPGNPLPPGHNGFPPPGHLRPMPNDIDYVAPLPAGVPAWAPPAPQAPSWAPFAPVVWNSELQVWGIWAGSSFVAL